MDIKKTTLLLEEDIYGENSFALKQKLNAYFEDDIFNLILDLSKVNIIDSIGLGVLLKFHQKLSKKQGSIALLNANQNILNLLEMTHLNQYIKVL